MRIQFKGGVWKNSEDEILKAAVMKYGQNQWARISSLLVRKSAKQCKARWFEWLDPAIKKTEWTREEEEQLLHLAKIMPTSWRTIAPRIGRTATQCLEHYEKLLDQAQRGPEDPSDAAGPSSTSGAASGKPRPGDMDAFPESRPARPDPVDMDEDELEMLSEARARLANTKGKKAKRKAREKQLEAAKRLAHLQKRRELKAAGVDLKPRRNNRKVTDYATEIPFERAPVPGFYDTRVEDDRVASEIQEKKQLGRLLQKYKGKTEEEYEEEARKRDAEKLKQLEKVNLPAALGLGKKSAAPESPPLKRARLSLPAPQVSDLELERIAKTSTIGNASQSKTGDLRKTNGHASETLDGRFVNSVASTPQQDVESWATVRKRHLETIMKLKSSQTPLRGGESTSLHLGLENGITPMRSNLQTPNPLATPLSVCNESHLANSKSMVAQAEREEARRLSELIRSGLQSLPEPENEYQIEVVKDAFEGSERNRELDGGEQLILEDAEEEAARKKKMYESQIEEEKSKLLSHAAKRFLPLPHLTNQGPTDSDTVAFLVERDAKALKILRQHSSSDEKPSRVVELLRSLRRKDSLDEQHVIRGKALVDEELGKEKNGAEATIAAIVEAIKRTKPLTSFRCD